MQKNCLFRGAIWGAIMFMAFSLAACSVPILESPSLAPESAFVRENAGVMYNLRITRQGRQKFSGILGVRNVGDDLHFAMLDATGILLLEADVHADGSFAVTRAVGKIADSQLPGYLAKTLYNIFYVRPEQLPCADSGFMELCLEQVGSTATKYLKFGPFTLWNLQIEEKTGEVGEIYHYSQGWLGIIIELQQLLD